jgi:hypothetical protein
MDVILKYTTTNGTTYHEVDLIKKKHKVTILETETVVETSTNKKWGSQENFVEGLISKEITTLEGKILVQKTTIADCIRYKSEDHLHVTKRKLDENRERLTFLTSYEF